MRVFSISKALALEAPAWLQHRSPSVGTANPTAGLDIELVTTRAAFDALEADWNQLASRNTATAGLFLGFNWNWHWCNHYLDKDGSRLAIVVGRRDGRLVMLLPLLQKRAAGLRVLCFMGAPVSQYGDVLIEAGARDPEAWLRQGWVHVIGQLRPDIVVLRKVRDDSAAAILMRALGASAHDRQRAPFIDLRGATDFDVFEQRYSGKDRKNRRRKRKRLEETGVLGFRKVAGAADAGASVARATELKRSWLTGRQLVSVALAEHKFDAFFRNVAACTERPAGCDIYELTLDGCAIATKIAVTSGTHRALHFTCYDKAAEKHSPGSLICENMLQGAIADGIATFDFLAPAAPYKFEWADSTIGIADYSVPVSVAGRLYHDLYLRALRPWLQRLAKNGPAPIRRLISAAVKSA